MKNRIKLTYLLIILIISSNMSAQLSFQWATKFGDGCSLASGQSITTDASGYIYSIGIFTGTGDFDPGPGTQTFTAGLYQQGLYINKFDALGNLIWVKVLTGGNINDNPQISLNSVGEIFVCGNFSGLVDFDPGSSVYNFNSSYGGFILKLDINGNFLWAKNYDNYSNYSTIIKFDHFNNIILSGTFYGDIGFNTGADKFYLSSQSISVYFCKMDTNGNFIWAKNFPSGHSDILYDMDIDQDGNIYAFGSFSTKMDADPNQDCYLLTCPVGTYNACFITKIDSVGNFVWAKRFGDSYVDTKAKIKVDAHQNVYLTGSFNSAINFDLGNGVNTHISLGADDIFIMKLDSIGTMAWLDILGSANDERSTALALDNAGNIIIAGNYKGTVDFDPGAGVHNMTAGTDGIFVLKLDSNGGYISSGSLNGTSTKDKAGCLTIDRSGNIYLTGHFEGTIDFDPGVGVYNLTGASDAFLVKF